MVINLFRFCFPATWLSSLTRLSCANLHLMATCKNKTDDTDKTSHPFILKYVEMDQFRISRLQSMRSPYILCLFWGDRPVWNVRLQFTQKFIVRQDRPVLIKEFFWTIPISNVHCQICYEHKLMPTKMRKWTSLQALMRWNKVLESQTFLALVINYPDRKA